jgi:hypothetical protein
VLKIKEGSVFIFQAINKNAVAAEQITGKWSIFRGTCKSQHPVKGKVAIYNKIVTTTWRVPKFEEFRVRAFLHITVNGSRLHRKCTLVRTAAAVVEIYSILYVSQRH